VIPSGHEELGTLAETSQLPQGAKLSTPMNKTHRAKFNLIKHPHLGICGVTLFPGCTSRAVVYSATFQNKSAKVFSDIG
jgi:hypothetical protein